MQVIITKEEKIILDLLRKRGVDARVHQDSIEDGIPKEYEFTPEVIVKSLSYLKAWDLVGQDENYHFWLTKDGENALRGANDKVQLSMQGAA